VLTLCAGGGDNFWTVYLTGVTRNQIQNLDPASASASSMTTSPTGASTVVVTAGPTGASSGKPSGGPSTVGIAVGVVVGLIAIAGIALGAFLWLRHNRRKEAEDEFKRQNAITNFVEGGKTSNGAPSNDSRLDPHVFAARRDSSGSIADNADYSRRILQVGANNGQWISVWVESDNPKRSATPTIFDEFIKPIPPPLDDDERISSQPTSETTTPFPPTES
jgi:cell wall integrity and stress response component